MEPALLLLRPALVFEEFGQSFAPELTTRVLSPRHWGQLRSQAIARTSELQLVFAHATKPACLGVAPAALAAQVAGAVYFAGRKFADASAPAAEDGSPSYAFPVARSSSLV